MSQLQWITPLSLPGKVYWRVLESWVSDYWGPVRFLALAVQCWNLFCTLSRILQGGWKFTQLVYICFVDLEKAFNCVIWGVLWWGISWVQAARPLWYRLLGCCTTGGRAWCWQWIGFSIRDWPCQGWPLSPILFITFLGIISWCRQVLRGLILVVSGFGL